MPEDSRGPRAGALEAEGVWSPTATGPTGSQPVERGCSRGSRSHPQESEVPYTGWVSAVFMGKMMRGRGPRAIDPQEPVAQAWPLADELGVSTWLYDRQTDSK